MDFNYFLIEPDDVRAGCSLFPGKVVLHEIGHHFTVLLFPRIIAVFGDIIEYLSETFDQLASVFSMREKEKLTGHHPRLFGVTLGRTSGQSRRAQTGKLLENLTDVRLLKFFVDRCPLHDSEHFVEIFPFEAQKRTLSRIQFGVHFDVVSCRGGRLTSNSIPYKTVLASASEAAVSICAKC